MSRRKDESASVATYADHEVITPPHELRRAIAPATDTNDDPIGRAEAALVELSGEFTKWMQSECDRLESSRKAVMHLGFTEQTREALYRAAHDIKGEAATFGYPNVVGVAESLCRLIEHTPPHSQIPKPLVEQHVDAIRAIVREYSRSDRAEVAQALTKRLREVTDEFLTRENSFRPDYLETIFAPAAASNG
jgi:HPt (histidine-containing phosphotransfer) domain-containing protein